MVLLAETDALHDTLSGPATQHVMQRAGLRGHPHCAAVFISMAHLHNLRAATGYRARRQQWAKTRPTGIAIGERRAQPGAPATCASTRAIKDEGISHINAVDCVKWEIVATCERLSEAYLLPVIKATLEALPSRGSSSFLSLK
ncbi:MAG: hypothetical protein M3461_16495 [Pseudomonadota bacterium]|nr:hypothetical protein [Pseudomonadota bacterium]